jgi:nucleotidyltransferase substrate binding protein (TIGR01987 family)
MTKLSNRLTTFERALDRLREAIDEADTELEIDGAIQRFEFTYELFWKVLKAHLEDEGIPCRSPRACFKEAYALRLIENEDDALRMLEDRNETVHLYDEAKSRQVFDRIKTSYVVLFGEVAEKLRKVPRRDPDG